MNTKTFYNSHFTPKGDYEANWNKAINYIPQDKEIIIYKPDQNHSEPRIKIGNGINIVKDLPFAGVDTKAVKELINEKGELLIDYVDNAIDSIVFPTVDQTFDETSENAQSGIAIAEVLNEFVSELDNTFNSISESFNEVANEQTAQDERINGLEKNMVNTFNSISESFNEVANEQTAQDERIDGLEKNMVTLDTNQDITGTKTFLSSIELNKTGGKDGKWPASLKIRGPAGYDMTIGKDGVKSIIKVNNPGYSPVPVTTYVFEDLDVLSTQDWGAEQTVATREWTRSYLNALEGQVANHQIILSTSVAPAIEDMNNALIKIGDKIIPNLQAQIPTNLYNGEGSFSLHHNNSMSLGTASIAFNHSMASEDAENAMAVNAGRAKNQLAFAAGEYAHAKGWASAAFGGMTFATEPYQFVCGYNNLENSGSYFIVGNGSIDFTHIDNVNNIPTYDDAVASEKYIIKNVDTGKWHHVDKMLSQSLYDQAKSNLKVYQLLNPSNAFEVRRNGVAWAQKGFTVGDTQSEYCEISNNLIYLGYTDEYSEAAHTKLSHNGLKHQGADATWELDGLGLKMVTSEGYMRLDSEERFIEIGGSEEDTYQLIFPLEDGTLATQEWTGLNFIDLTTSQSISGNKTFKDGITLDSSLRMYDLNASTRASLFLKGSSLSLGDQDLTSLELNTDETICRGDLICGGYIEEAGQKIYDKYIQYNKIRWDNFIQKVIATNVSTPFFIVEVSELLLGRNVSVYKDPLVKKYMSLHDFKNGGFISVKIYEASNMMSDWFSGITIAYDEIRISFHGDHIGVNPYYNGSIVDLDREGDLIPSSLTKIYPSAQRPDDLSNIPCFSIGFDMGGS
jgi:hypothetical protein